jgi:ATP phosphoribosyltransferase
VLVVFTVVPKNSGLKRCKDILADFRATGEILEVRGEDVPFWVEELLKKGKDTIGVTGQDLYTEYCLRNNATRTKVLKFIDWDDEAALFRKPTLCLLGPKDKSLKTIPKNQRVCISDKYKLLAERYLSSLENNGFTFERFYVKGSVESSLLIGIADLAIDIVYTGRSMNELGLNVYDKLFYSNIVLVGGNEK